MRHDQMITAGFTVGSSAYIEAVRQQEKGGLPLIGRTADRLHQRLLEIEKRLLELGDELAGPRPPGPPPSESAGPVPVMRGGVIEQLNDAMASLETKADHLSFALSRIEDAVRGA
ncbi:hypothetical protein [Falsiroseomonas tokyonensis]|uniref:Uncharacterized protein n=1 Tax=Falsiroseomonas tokyonensis TaxID=430521 RepID=A0ABV7BXT6_9PROT|nr:hypothetical protein [Falsiroseomonas tokyonensis]MBU8540231.1 hypothetical protein [Falsiroseomonas tokyonensis]